jgi:NAD(P)-dependent dehydrogenase (short-subunit alcohol dehydrogenase family)
MGGFAGAVAIVTGGASGIGRAIGEELVRRGSRVVLADIDAEAAQAAARAMVPAGAASGISTDVRDAEAVARLVGDTVAEHGRLDLMFNNAGIATFGEVRDQPLEDWNAMIDVNLRGVVNGVAAAYPVMIRQGFGHIVNTASAAGLAPAPAATCYATTKHAVVGLSTSLRAEAARFGVWVSVACPGFIDTPIKHSARLLNTDRETALKALPVRLHPADACARAILHGVERNRPIIVVTGFARAGWLLYRLFPRLMIAAACRMAKTSELLDQSGSRPRGAAGS